MLTEKVSTMGSRHTAVEEVVKRLEEREKVLQTAVSNMEKEINLRQQAIECHKRKAIEVGSQCQEMIYKHDALSKNFEEVIRSNLLAFLNFIKYHSCYGGIFQTLFNQNIFTVIIYS